MSDLIPPDARSNAALGLTAAAAIGRFELQVCDRCGTLQYPAREACVNCLGDRLTWREHSGDGELIATTAVHHSNHAYFRGRTPWNIGIVRLDGDVSVIAHLHHACVNSPGKVRVRALLDRGGRGVLFAFPTDAALAAQTDPQVVAMTCAPRNKRILVTDGSSEVGKAIVEALLAAGAQRVWSGVSGTEKSQPSSNDTVVAVPLDVTDLNSIAAAAGQLGEQVDIVINNAEIHGGPAASPARTLELAQAEMATNYLGSMKLAAAFVPPLLARAHSERSQPSAWVNVLSIYALSTLPSHGTFCASKAAALSFAQSLRAQLRQSGVRVLNIFPGPIDTASFRDVQLPKLAPKALARALVEALELGVEDCYPGDVARDFLRRWRQDPKVLELELQP